MANNTPPKRATALDFDLDLYGFDGKYLSGATFDSTEISKDGGAFAAMTNAPVEIGSTGVYTISLTAPEMTADRVHLKLVVTGAPDVGILIETVARRFDDLAFPTTTGNGIDVAATGEVGLDFSNIKQAAAPTTLTDITIPLVTLVTTTTTLTNAPADSAGVTTLLGRLTNTRAGYLDLLNSFLDSSVAALQATADLIQAKTDLLPVDPAIQSDILAAIATTISTITAQTDIIKAKTNNLPASPAATGAQMDLVNAPNAVAVTAIQSGLATAAAVTTVQNRLGAFTGTGINTVLGFMRAMFNKGASTPSDLTTGGLTGDPTTDSLEAIRDRGDSTWVGGGGGASAASIADAVWDEARTDHVTAGSFGQGAASVQGNVTGSVGSVTGNVGGNLAGNVNGTVPDSAGTTTLLSRLTSTRAGLLDNLAVLAGFAGTLLDMLRAMGRNDSSSADMGGTYDAATDSQEAIRNKLNTVTAAAPVTNNENITELDV